MRTRRGSLWARPLDNMIDAYEVGDIVRPVIVPDGFIGSVRHVDKRLNKVWVAWGGGSLVQHDPDEIQLVPYADETTRRKLASRRTFLSKQEMDVPAGDQFVGDPKVHGIDEPRGGGFNIMQQLQEDLHEESEEEADKGPIVSPVQGSRRTRSAAVVEELVTRWEDDGVAYERKTTTWNPEDGKLASARHREGAAGPYMILMDLRDDFRKGRLEDDDVLDRWGFAMGHAKGADYIFGDAGEAIVYGFLDYAAGRKDQDDVLRIVKRNILKAVKDNEDFKGLSAERSHDTWMEKMQGKRASEGTDYSQLRSRRALSVPERHQKNIAIKTLKMSDLGAKIMGGMTKAEAREFLKSIGWSDSKIRRLEASDYSQLRSRRGRQAMYWTDKDRTYRLTRREQQDGNALCPKCREMMDKQPFTKREKLLSCPGCGFKIPTGKTVTERKVEIEVGPEGVEVEIEPVDE